MDLYKNRKIKITKNATNNKLKTCISPLNYNKRSFHSSTLLNYKHSIKPLNITPVTPRNFTTLDIETITFNNIQIPILITLHNKINSKIFLIDNILFKLNPTQAIDNLWRELFNYLLNNIKNVDYRTIFVHNLGSFDGFFIYKYLSLVYPENVKTLIDEQNKFILIEWKIGKNKIKFLDSYRIFPVSVDELCDIFNVEGKLSKYNPEFNNLSLFDKPDLLNTFKQYAMQDSSCLFNALSKAQEYYLDNFSVDITDIVSLPSLSLKIFRSKFLECDIPILKPSQDTFIRRGYFGGATDYYKCFIKEGRKYDINSLYPDSMLKNPMPYKVIKFHNNLTNIKLDDFFGFALVKVTYHKNMERPMLPYKHEGKTIFPTGTWVGVYFSEELKAMVKLGYKIKLINGYEFSKIDLFSSYVDYFYKIKK